MELLRFLTEVFKALGGLWSVLGIAIFTTIGEQIVISCEPITTTQLGYTYTTCLESTLSLQGAALGAVLGFVVALIRHKRGG